MGIDIRSPNLNAWPNTAGHCLVDNCVWPRNDVIDIQMAPGREKFPNPALGGLRIQPIVLPVARRYHSERVRQSAQGQAHSPPSITFQPHAVLSVGSSQPGAGFLLGVSHIGTSAQHIQTFQEREPLSSGSGRNPASPAKDQPCSS